jgi:hypothetical protein
LTLYGGVTRGIEPSSTNNIATRDLGITGALKFEKSLKIVILQKKIN